MCADYFLYIHGYEGEPKVMQYFVSVKHNSAAPDMFAKVEKVMNHTGEWGTKFAWYSPRFDFFI